MSSLTISLLAFACIFGGALLGMLLRGALPETQLTGDSRDTVKLGTAFISTLTALVLGLLIGSAKGTLDEMNSGLTQLGAKVILIDRVLARYGPETKPARDALRRTIAARIQTSVPAVIGVCRDASSAPASANGSANTEWLKRTNER